MAYYPYAVEKGAIYTLVAPTGTKAVFNDPLDPSYVGMLTDVTGLDSPEIRESAEDLTEADGGDHGAFYFGRRPISLTASVFGHTSIANRNARIDLARRASLAMRGDSILSWKPSTRFENLLKNPTLTLDNSNIVNAAPGMAINRLVSPASSVPGFGGGAGTGYQWSGTISSVNGYMIFKGNGAGTAGSLPDAVPVTPTKKYSVRGWTRLVTLTSGAVSDMRILVWWYKADGTISSVTSSVTVASVNSPAAGATEYDWSGLVTPPSDAVGGIPAVYATVTNPTTLEIRGSKMMMDEATAVETYVDGDTAGYHWQGDRGASTSGDFVEMYTTVRRQQRFQEGGGWVKEIQVPLVSEYATVFSTGQKSLTGSPVVCENRGNYTAYPLIEITGAAVNPTITSAASGVLTTTGLTLAAGEKIVFDTLNHTAAFTAGARLGQSGNRYINFATTTWPQIPAASTSSISTSAGTLKVTWRDVWA